MCRTWGWECGGYLRHNPCLGEILNLANETQVEPKNYKQSSTRSSGGDMEPRRAGIPVSGGGVNLGMLPERGSGVGGLGCLIRI